MSGASCREPVCSLGTESRSLRGIQCRNLHGFTFEMEPSHCGGYRVQNHLDAVFAPVASAGRSLG